MIFEPMERRPFIFELEVLPELIAFVSAVFGLLIPGPPSFHSCLFFDHDLLGLKFDSFGLCEL